MGGIGKTTLANAVYNDACIRFHFDVCAWATISQQHNVKEILLSLLRSTKSDSFDMNDEAELANMLQKSLKGKRYLIVLDDMWKTESWDAVRLCFPSENKGSGILLTTRNSEVARDAGTENLSLQMDLMGPDESWNLFKSVAFANEALPSEFETIGKQIVEKCHGLPLTIAVVARLLKSKRAIEEWENVAKDVKSFVTNDPDERCSRVLSLRKMKPFKRVTVDEIDYCRSGLYRALLTPVHRQLRDHDNNDLFNRTRSIFSSYPCTSHLFRKSELIHFKLLKVLELRNIKMDHFPVQILSLIWLRYLLLYFRKYLEIPPEICRLWNLQTFIVQGPSLWKITFPEEILGLMQLRHLKLPEFYLPNPPSVSADKGSHVSFSNIQTISSMSPCCCTKEFIMRIQNVKELGLSAYQIDSSDGPLNSLVHLQQLETLSLTYRFGGFWPASAKAFPATLKKLKLDKTYLSWSYLDIIAELPNLEVLKLMYRACDGEEWRPTVMGFNRLKLLLIDDNDLKYWKATDDFPVLERLVLRRCHYLEKIPIEFAGIHSLQLIELNWGPPKLGDSAARIQQEQEEIGNNPVDVHIFNPLISCFFPTIESDQKKRLLEDLTTLMNPKSSRLSGWEA
ncbi:hypothetical protein CQW23_06850 [Capsicum baccatum]|uniref:Uncharacterized protein n=1 Tax=Capsicum baccatum TaxID=33114 RepID=A0A2G2X4I0_CAPBA|nr:hypothetical protein CQW23_06850 [Capsicum baccatum]